MLSVSEFVRVCEQSTELHFDNLDIQLQNIDAEVNHFYFFRFTKIVKYLILFLIITNLINAVRILAIA